MKMAETSQREQKILWEKTQNDAPFVAFYDIPLGECNTILSAYTLYRHLG